MSRYSNIGSAALLCVSLGLLQCGGGSNSSPTAKNDESEKSAKASPNPAVASAERPAYDATSFAPAVLASPQPADQFPGKAWSSVVFSADGTSVAVISETGDRLVANDIEVEGYSFFREVGWSANGKLAFIAARGGEPETGRLVGWTSDTWFVVVGDAEYGPYRYALALRLDEDGGFSAQVSPALLKRAVLVDGKQGRTFDELPSSSVIYVERKLVAYAGLSKQPQEACVVFSNKEHCFPGTKRPVISADGSTVAFVTINTERKVRLVVNGTPGPPFDNISRVELSRDGAHVTYEAKDAKGEFVVHDGQRGPTFDRAFSLRLSPDGALPVYWARRGEQWFVVAGAKETPIGKPGGELVVSKDSNHYASLAHTEDNWTAPEVAIVDGQSSEGEEMITSLVMSHAGVAGYKVSEGKQRRMVVGDKRGELYDDVWELEFGPVEGTFAYAARRGADEFIVTDSGTHGPFKDVGSPDNGSSNVGSAVFAPNGVAVWRGQTDQGWSVFVGGKPGPPAEKIFKPIRFAPHQAGYGVLRDGKFAWEVAAIPELADR